MGPSAIQILVVVGIILIFFGAGRLAGLGQGLGDGIRNFRKAVGDVGDDRPARLPSSDDGADGEPPV